MNEEQRVDNRPVGRLVQGAWVCAHAALAGLALWVFDILLLKRHLDRLAILGGALLAIFLLVLASRATAHRATGLRPGRLRRVWRRVGRADLVYVALFLAFLFVFHWQFMRARVDGRAYFAQVRSFVIDLDADFTNENEEFAVQGSADHFASGAPILWTPFFLAAHWWLALLNLLGGEYARDGYFNPYQRAVGLGTIVYGVIALVLIRRLASRYFSERVATISTVALCLGSFVGWYLSVDVSYAHGVSMFTTALFVYYWDSTRKGTGGASAAAAQPARGQRTPREWIVLGGLVGLMSMARWQNVLFAIIPAGESLLLYAGAWRRDRQAGHERRHASVRELLLKHALFAVAAIAAFFPQMIVWKIHRGSWFDIPDEVHPIRWGAPDFTRELFSSDRGLFSWTPVVLLGVLGLFVFARHHKLFGALLLAAFVAQVYISSTILSVGHGPGARKFTNCAVIFCIGLAALIDWLRRRPLVAPTVVLATLVVVNVFFNFEMRTTDLEQHNAVPTLRLLGGTTSRLGNPFALPMNAWVAFRYGVPLYAYERVGSQTYNNVRIDVGSEGDDKFLMSGWSNREIAPDFSFRWAVGIESALLVQLKEADVYTLEVLCAPFVYRDAPLQTIEVWVNGELAGRIPLSERMDWHRLTIDNRFVKAGLNGIHLRYQYAVSPASLGQSSDARELAVQFDRLNLIRNP